MGTEHLPNTLVLLSLGRRPVERPCKADPHEPQPHWREVALRVNADIQSWQTACTRRGPLFSKLFDGRPLWGSAASAAADASRYSHIYALDEDVGFRLALLLNARGWRGRLLCLVHHVTPKRRKVVEFLGGRVLSHFLTLSDRQRDALIAAGVPSDKITSAPIPTDTSFFKPASSATSGERPRLVAIGAADRDYATLFAAAPSICADIEVFGHGYAGSDAAGLRGVALPPNVHLMPHMTVAALRDRMAGADGAILALKPVDYAAGGTVLVESMACALPVIVSDIPGIGSYLSDSRPGPVVPPGDPAALALAATTLLADRTAAQAQGQANREWVLAHASVDGFAQRVIALLKNEQPGGSFWR